MLKLLSDLINVTLICVVVSIIILTIKWVLKTFWCVEHFDGGPASDPIMKRVLALQTIRDTIISDLDELDDAADSACEINKQIEATYVANNAAPEDPVAESQLPNDVQTKNKARRTARAQQRFKEEKKRFSSLHNAAPVYECFADVGATEEDLRVLIGSIQQLMNSAEAKAAACKVTGVESLVGFNAKYVGPTTEGFDTGSAGCAVPVAAPTITLTGAELLAAADDLITKGNTVHMAIQLLVATVKAQQKSATQMNQKSQNLQNGQVSAADVDAAQAATASPS
jgi:hypothetical protein